MLCVLLHSIKILCFILLVTISNKSFSNEKAVTVSIIVNEIFDNEIKYEFYGLASYYNDLKYYLVSDKEIKKLESNSNFILQKEEWLAIVLRNKVVIIKNYNLNIQILNNKLNFHKDAANNKITLKEISKIEFEEMFNKKYFLRYINLPSPLAWLAIQIENILSVTYEFVFKSWGLSIIFLAFVMRIILFPVTLLTIKQQYKVSITQSQLEPKLIEIKKNYDGEEAHNLIMQAHKDEGVTPFYSIKPLLFTLIQIPFLIVIFNVLGEMSSLSGQSFLWITDLSLPDNIGMLPISIPLFGNVISLLPIVMLLLGLIFAYLLKNNVVNEEILRKKKINLYLMAICFFILFYPFPSSMLLYWIAAMLLQFMQERIVKV